eukprot:CAMPEP_0115108648 /NCGR_PEP_ID=MMETSP0227-20121206/38131_1 /TAXON_ID=89957 /ORGANISM="Polarella glacialis, Strain CCMP 1383" /LENGTH=35 /DNA_ID= /DNA_START= /DNA_END= /DNA_ORIENTATION=
MAVLAEGVKYTAHHVAKAVVKEVPTIAICFDKSYS